MKMLPYAAAASSILQDKCDANKKSEKVIKYFSSTLDL
jgi:hypothetical protein